MKEKLLHSQPRFHPSAFILALRGRLLTDEFEKATIDFLTMTLRRLAAVAETHARRARF
jgi:hypothetical protein